MTTLRVCVKKQRSDWYYPVYIRVNHGRQSGFIKTDKMVDRKSVTKTREIRDNMVLKYCTELISEYNNKLNMQDTSQWSVKEIISFLTTEQSDVSFSEYARLHIKRMINSGHNRNAKNYRMTVASLEQYMGTNKIMFSYLDTVSLSVPSLRHTQRNSIFIIDTDQIRKVKYISLVESSLLKDVISNA